MSRSQINFPVSDKNKNRSTIHFQLSLIHFLSNLTYCKIPKSDSKDGSKNDIEKVDNKNAKAFIAKNSKSFRQNYPKYFADLTLRCVENPKAFSEIAKEGLNFVQEKILFAGSEKSLACEMAENTAQIFSTKILEPSKEAKRKKFGIVYKGKKLVKEDMIDQVEKWEIKGVMEHDAKNAIIDIALTEDQKPEIMASISNHVFILIGAGSAMGPFKTLLEQGATVVAIDIPRENIWNRLFAIHKEANCGKLIYPFVDFNGKEKAGCDLLKQPAEIANWLKTLKVFKEKKVTIGNYTYLDGSMHVLLSAAADAIIQSISDYLQNKINISFLCTPSDVSVVPSGTFYSSKEKLKVNSINRFIDCIFHYLSMGRLLKENNIKKFQNGIYIYNGLAVAQGPNYALAKMIQLWRAALHYENAVKGEFDSRLSFNVAPASFTASVVHKKMFDWVLKGMPYFKPIEIFQPETSSTLMAGLLISDIVLPKNKLEKDSNALLIKSKQAIHGGAWRCAYSTDSIGLISALVYFLGGPKMFTNVLMAIFVIPYLMWMALS